MSPHLNAAVAGTPPIPGSVDKKGFTVNEAVHWTVHKRNKKHPVNKVNYPGNNFYAMMEVSGYPNASCNSPMINQGTVPRPEAQTAITSSDTNPLTGWFSPAWLSSHVYVPRQTDSSSIPFWSNGDAEPEKCFSLRSTVNVHLYNKNDQYIKTLHEGQEHNISPWSASTGSGIDTYVKKINTEVPMDKAGTGGNAGAGFTVEFFWIEVAKVTVTAVDEAVNGTNVHFTGKADDARGNEISQLCEWRWGTEDYSYDLGYLGADYQIFEVMPFTLGAQWMDHIYQLKQTTKYVPDAVFGPDYKTKYYAFATARVAGSSADGQKEIMITKGTPAIAANVTTLKLDKTFATVARGTTSKAEGRADHNTWPSFTTGLTYDAYREASQVTISNADAFVGVKLGWILSAIPLGAEAGISTSTNTTTSVIDRVKSGTFTTTTMTLSASDTFDIRNDGSVIWDNKAHWVYPAIISKKFEYTDEFVAGIRFTGTSEAYRVEERRKTMGVRKFEDPYATWLTHSITDIASIQTGDEMIPPPKYPVDEHPVYTQPDDGSRPLGYNN